MWEPGSHMEGGRMWEPGSHMECGRMWEPGLPAMAAIRQAAVIKSR